MERKLGALILDDERRGRELLQKLLQFHCREVDEIVLAASIDEAVEVLKTFKPDILFLDMQIGNENGFDILPFLSDPSPAVIITTAHQEFAIKALRAKATDYLLKPIIADELKSAVKKVLEQLPASMERRATDKKITVPTSDGLIFIKVLEIIRCEASGAYTHLYLQNGKSILVSMNLGEVEKLLPENLGFFRVHHASLINTAEIMKYIKNDGGYVILSDQSKVAISQRKKNSFLSFLGL